MKDESKVFCTSIAGINFRVTGDDVGPIIGYVSQDKGNEHDPRAVGVYKPSGELLGYIASKDLDNFYDFKGEGFDSMIFAGNIKQINRAGSSYFVGNIAIFRVESEEETTELIDKYMMDEGFNLYGQTYRT